MPNPRILTTVVGSYPVPDWLAAAPSEQALIDATRVVIATQEQAGIDLVCDGELYRFDLNHPETNGMIEYFTRPMSGIRSDIGFSEWLDYAKGTGMKFRTRPPGVVEGKVGAGSLNLPIPCARARALASRPFKFTLTGPHMLAKTLHDRHYRDPEKLAHAIADVLVEQVRCLDAEVIQVDEANLPAEEIAILGDTGSARIDTLVQDIVDRSREAGDIAQSEEVGGAMLRLRKFMFQRVYLGPEARGEHARVERTVRGLFDYFAENPAELPSANGTPGEDEVQRVVDYLAGMTDRYCIATFRRLALPEESRL